MPSIIEIRNEIEKQALSRCMGRPLYVKPTGSDTYSGRTKSKAMATIAAAIAAASSGDMLLIGPGSYDEAVTIARGKSLTLVGLGPRGSVAIAPSASPSTALTNHADDVEIENVGLDGEGTGGALSNTGSRLRVKRSKIEGGETLALLTLGTVAQIAAATRGKGADLLFEDCEFCWGDADGIDLQASDYGALTQAYFRRCTLHNITTNHVTESLGAGASAAVGYRDIVFDGCIFRPLEDGTMPTKFFDLNDDNANTGLVTDCVLPQALNAGTSLVSTAMLWVANRHPAGLSNGQPS